MGVQTRTQYFSKNVILKGEAEMKRACVLFWGFSAYTVKHDMHGTFCLKMNTPKLTIGICQQDLPPLKSNIDIPNMTPYLKPEISEIHLKKTFCWCLFVKLGVNLGTSWHSISWKKT